MAIAVHSQRPGSRRPRPAGAAAALLAGFVLATGAQAASSLPERFDASFVLTARGMDLAQTHWQLEPTGDGGYVYRSTSEAVGLAKLLRDERVEERSEWRFSSTGAVMPLHYSYTRSGGKRPRVVEVHFDWKNHRAQNTFNGHSWNTGIEPGTLDKQVYLLELMRELAAGTLETRYEVADGGKVKTYRLKVVGEERLETALGTLDTVVVDRAREDDEGITRVWCAPSLHYLPVRVEHSEEDGTVRLSITRLEGLAP